MGTQFSLTYAYHADGLDMCAVQRSRRPPSQRPGKLSHALISGLCKGQSLFHHVLRCGCRLTPMQGHCGRRTRYLVPNRQDALKMQGRLYPTIPYIRAHVNGITMNGPWLWSKCTYHWRK